MRVPELLSIIVQIAKQKGYSAPFICGGAPRDKVMGKLENVDDLDITTGDVTVRQLAKDTAKQLGPNAHYLGFPDGHSQINIDGVKLDFSSNFISPGIMDKLARAGLEDPTPMQKELYSRDFTANSLLMSMDLKTIQDPLGVGIADIKRRIIRTCLPAEVTLNDDPRRIARAIYLAAKLGFELDPEIVEWVKTHRHAINRAKPRYVTQKLVQAFKYNRAQTPQLIDQLGLWKHVRISKEFMPVVGNLGRT